NPGSARKDLSEEIPSRQPAARERIAAFDLGRARQDRSIHRDQADDAHEVAELPEDPVEGLEAEEPAGPELGASAARHPLRDRDYQAALSLRVGERMAHPGLP